jgi:uncharacterized protein (TIGR03437 family)
MSLIRLLSVGFFLPLLAFGQSGTVAGSGYRVPSNNINVAPGQVLTISVSGVRARLAASIRPEPGLTGFPTVVQTLSLALRQGDATTLLPIRFVQQTRCATGAAGVGVDCVPLTTFTVQVPDELAVEPAASIDVREGDTLVTRAALNVVPDDVHIMNTCDQTGQSVNIAFDVPAGACASIIAHANGSLVTPTNPAKPGETLVIWAYGLGALDRPYPDLSVPIVSPDQLPLAAQPFNVGFAYGRSMFRRLAQSIPTYTGMVGGGFYQVHFVVPTAPAGLPACDGFKGNLRVLLSGPTSADSAALCLEAGN